MGKWDIITRNIMINTKTKEVYMVERLLEKIEVTNPLTNEMHAHKINGLYGYLPVYETLEQAEVMAENGKYKILTATITQ